MSENKVDNGAAGEIKQTETELQRFQKSYYKGRHRTVMLTDKVTVLSVSSVSTITWTDLDLSAFKVTGGTGDISDDTIALILLLSVNDSGSAGASTLFHVRPKGSTDDPGHIVIRGSHINDVILFNQGICKIDSNFEIQYEYTASGAGTLDAKIEIVGYLEQLR